MRIYIYACAYARSIVYTCTQFAQTNSLTTRTRVYIINASNAMPKPYLYTYVLTYARTYTHTVDREQYSQTTHANEHKLIVAFDVWAISACKRVCVLHVRAKTFRMYYTLHYLRHVITIYSAMATKYMGSHNNM